VLSQKANLSTSDDAKGSHWRVPTVALPSDHALLHTRMSTHPKGSRWHVPIVAFPSDHPLLHTRMSTHPKSNHWRVPTATHASGHPLLHTCRSTHPRDNRWLAATLPTSSSHRCMLHSAFPGMRICPTFLSACVHRYTTPLLPTLSSTALR